MHALDNKRQEIKRALRIQPFAPREQTPRQPSARQKWIYAQPRVAQQLIERQHVLLVYRIGVGDWF